jgi:hypothetical protein
VDKESPGVSLDIMLLERDIISNFGVEAETSYLALVRIYWENE